MKKLVREFREFAFRGNVLDMAVGIMIGGAISNIVSSLVNDIVMPLVGLITGGIDFNNMFIAFDGKSYETLAQAQEAGTATFNYGTFITYIIDFLLMAICIFFVLKLLVRFKKPKEVKPARKCPFCFGEINDKATRCPHCTSVLDDSTVQTQEA